LNILRLTVLFCLVCSVSTARSFEALSTPVTVSCLTNSSAITLKIELEDLHESISTGDFSQFADVAGPGTTYERNRPILPSVSRFVVVPPDAGLELCIEADQPYLIQAGCPPALCLDSDVAISTDDPTGLYPPNIAEMSPPVVFRGVRLVKVTTYPVQWDAATGNYLVRDHIEATVAFTNDPPVNPASVPQRRNRSQEFLKVIRALAVNGDVVGRDDPLTSDGYRGHYLVVANQTILLAHRAFIEWRRKAGYRVDIIPIPNNQANSAVFIKNQIQTRYNQLLGEGKDPFDQILLIGDRSEYFVGSPRAGQVLAAENGNPTFRGAPHADYKYACLEGNDNIPDVSIGRFPSGGNALAGLVVGRTLAYEATPGMENPEWFERVGAYSQHWGNDANSAWHVTIHTTVRWGEEVLRRIGFDEVTVYEDMNWDREGAAVGPVLRNWLNEGFNLMIGRAENYYWRRDFNGVQNNTFFPINVCISGHGEEVAYNMFRNGSGDLLKGPVASTFCWGVPPTATSNYLWMQTVNGLLVEDMPLGWARVFAVTVLENHFPDFRTDQGNQSVYLHAKTDFDLNGDPGIQFWKGVPKVLTVDFPEPISEATRSLEVVVTDPDDGHGFQGAIVTLYAPGDMPVDNPAEYAAWDDIVSHSAVTDMEGIARFSLDNGENFVDGDLVYLTVTGREILPVFGEQTVGANLFGISLSRWEFTEREGNGDGEPNPGEEFEIDLFATNVRQAGTYREVRAAISTTSDFLTVVDGEVEFGNIAAGREVAAHTSFLLRIDPDAPDLSIKSGVPSFLDIDFISLNEHFPGTFPVDVRGPALVVNRVINPIIAFGENQLNVEISNAGRSSTDSLTATLVSALPYLRVLEPESSLPPIAAGESVRLSGGLFRIDLDSPAIPGSNEKVNLILTSRSGFADTLEVVLQAGQARANSPLGPDNYGYICLDNTDVDWTNAPVYDWIEINPNADEAEYDGVMLDFQGQSQYDMGESQVVPLGFETQFYGDTFDTITVTTDGYLVMDNQPRAINFQNWPLDQAIGAGLGMVAPFWDDLRFGQGTAIYKYHDEETGRFIIEWWRMRTSSMNIEFTFQVILHDRDFHPTQTGDQDILIQYRTFTANRNVRNGESEWHEDIPFASVGISSPGEKCGISYCYNNTYPIQSAALIPGRALLFTTTLVAQYGYIFGRVTDLDGGGPLSGVTITLSHGLEATSDANGFWAIDVVPAGIPFSLTARLAGFNDSMMVNLIIEESDSVRFNFALRHPEIALDHEFLRVDVARDTTFTGSFQIINDGNGSLNFVTSPVYRNGHGWLEIAPPSGTVEAGETIALEVHFSPGALDTGLFLADISIEHNALQHRTILPVNLHVLPPLSSQGEQAPPPTRFAIVGTYPNPFNASVRISYGLPSAELASLAIYDAAGRRVALLSDGIGQAGLNHAIWEASEMPAGIYICRLEAGESVSLRKVLLVR